MPLSESAISIFCQRCGTPWRKTNVDSGYYFASTSSFNIGDHTWPKAIVDAGEDITNCPTCPITSVDDSMTYPEGKIDGMDRRRVDPDGHDSEQASQGDADVVHRGSLE